MRYIGVGDHLRMNRTTFEALRDLPGKVIHADIRFVRRAALAPVLVAEGIKIDNTAGIELVLSVRDRKSVV